MPSCGRGTCGLFSTGHAAPQRVGQSWGDRQTRTLPGMCLCKNTPTHKHRQPGAALWLLGRGAERGSGAWSDEAGDAGRGLVTLASRQPA